VRVVHFQICKRRSKAANAKSPGPPTSTGKASHRPYKHLILLPFSAIKRIVDICETPGRLCLFLTGYERLCHFNTTLGVLFCCLCKIIAVSFATWFSLRFLGYRYECFYILGWVTWRTSGPWNILCLISQRFSSGIVVEKPRDTSWHRFIWNTVVKSGAGR